MDSNQNNPLAKFFRQPAIYIKLPSNGQYWPEGSLELPESGEIPVYPMTAADEITLKTPDALLNGQGVVNVIKSCCPNILDPWKAPSIDVDTLLISLRIASYGNNMEFETRCPKCNEEHNYDLPLDQILSSVQKPDYTKSMEINGLKIKLKPQMYFSVNQTNMVNFEEQRILQTINDETLTDEERAARFDAHLLRLVELNIQIVTDSTESITTPDGAVVTDHDMILEFYTNTGSKLLKEVQKHIQLINESALLKPQAVHCASCGEEFEIPILFDYANFFV